MAGMALSTVLHASRALLDAAGAGASEGCCEGMMGGMMWFGGWMGIFFWLVMLLFVILLAVGAFYLIASLARQGRGHEEELVREIRRLREEIRRLRGEEGEG
jgi:uncharacterized membrane protein